MRTINILIKTTFVGFCLAVIFTPVIWGFGLVIIGGHGSPAAYRNAYIFTAIVTSLIMFGKELDDGKPKG